MRMSQEFILKDVFVKYEEIKIGEQIGEGSFGIVFKATFRGAQVSHDLSSSLCAPMESLPSVYIYLLTLSFDFGYNRTFTSGGAEEAEEPDVHAAHRQRNR
jgi:hypothetical protein